MLRLAEDPGHSANRSGLNRLLRKWLLRWRFRRVRTVTVEKSVPVEIVVEKEVERVVDRPVEVIVEKPVTVEVEKVVKQFVYVPVPTTDPEALLHILGREFPTEVIDLVRRKMQVAHP